MTDNRSQRRLATLVLVALAVLLLVPALAMGFGMVGFGHMTGFGGTWGNVPGWMLLVGVVMQLLFLVVLVGGAVLLYRALTGGGTGDEALSELRSAYARGELSDDEYERRRERLERDR